MTAPTPSKLPRPLPSTRSSARDRLERPGGVRQVQGVPLIITSLREEFQIQAVMASGIVLHASSNNGSPMIAKGLTA